jgi:hypothetical protein
MESALASGPSRLRCPSSVVWSRLGLGRLVSLDPHVLAGQTCRELVSFVLRCAVLRYGCGLSPTCVLHACVHLTFVTPLHLCIGTVRGCCAFPVPLFACHTSMRVPFDGMPSLLRERMRVGAPSRMWDMCRSPTQRQPPTTLIAVNLVPDHD